ncbi:hypothetical protein ACR30L_06980 [Psychromonas sp. PT13]|uniref:hypothetical protein n=1 Tax=Psychromonas sp. PT13 TaxID=3439547 RepID=UPI003EB9DDDF
MKKLPLLVLATITSLPMVARAEFNPGAFYSNLGATLITNDSHDESAYYVELGYSHRFDRIFSADVSYKKVETFNSTVSAGSNDFSQTYDSYGVGVRADQQIGVINLFAKAGGNFIASELTTWNNTTASEQTDKDNSVKPYASAGINIASPFDNRITFGAAITYEMLPNDEHATSFSSGVNYAF